MKKSKEKKLLSNDSQNDNSLTDVSQSEKRKKSKKKKKAGDSAGDNEFTSLELDL